MFAFAINDHGSQPSGRRKGRIALRGQFVFKGGYRREKREYPHKLEFYLFQIKKGIFIILYIVPYIFGPFLNDGVSFCF